MKSNPNPTSKSTTAQTRKSITQKKNCFCFAEQNAGHLILNFSRTAVSNNSYASTKMQHMIRDSMFLYQWPRMTVILPHTYIPTWLTINRQLRCHPLEFLDQLKLPGLSLSFMQCTAPCQYAVTQDPLLNTKLPLDVAVMGKDGESAGSREQRKKTSNSR